MSVSFIASRNQSIMESIKNLHPKQIKIRALPRNQNSHHPSPKTDYRSGRTRNEPHLERYRRLLLRLLRLWLRLPLFHGRGTGAGSRWRRGRVVWYRSWVSTASTACAARPVDCESGPSNPTEKAGSCGSRVPPLLSFRSSVSLFVMEVGGRDESNRETE